MGAGAAVIGGVDVEAVEAIVVEVDVPIVEVEVEVVVVVMVEVVVVVIGLTVTTVVPEGWFAPEKVAVIVGEPAAVS